MGEGYDPLISATKSHPCTTYLHNTSRMTYAPVSHSRLFGLCTRLQPQSTSSRAFSGVPKPGSGVGNFRRMSFASWRHLIMIKIKI